MQTQVENAIARTVEYEYDLRGLLGALGGFWWTDRLRAGLHNPEKRHPGLLGL
jgi:hypothetical protein